MTSDQFSNLLRFVILMCKEFSGNDLTYHAPTYIMEKWNRLVGAIPSIKLDDYSDSVLRWYNFWESKHVDIMYVYEYQQVDLLNIVSFIDDLNHIADGGFYRLYPEDIVSAFENRIGNFNFGSSSPCSLHPDLLYQFERFMRENIRDINLILLTDESDNCG